MFVPLTKSLALSVMNKMCKSIRLNVPIVITRLFPDMAVSQIRWRFEIAITRFDFGRLASYSVKRERYEVLTRTASV